MLLVMFSTNSQYSTVPLLSMSSVSHTYSKYLMSIFRISSARATSCFSSEPSSSTSK